MVSCSGSYEVIPVSVGSGWSTVLQKDTPLAVGLCLGSDHPEKLGSVGQIVEEDRIDLACHVTFEAANDLSFR